MNNISMVESKLPPGFRFHPKDEELVCDYLMKKLSHNNDDSSLMIDVDLNKCEPWDIPQRACVGGKEWYFYTQRDRKYATGLRTNRATASGYWKATGKDRPIYLKGALIGMRKTLVFYQGRAPKGKKTDWVMHEFRIEGPHGPPKFSSSKEDWVLCRVFYKSREVATKPSIGSCYDNTISSSLPQLVDSQTHEYEYEQVPCFSINFNHHITTTTPELLFHNAFFKPITTLSADHTTIDSKLYANNNINNAPTYVGPTNLGSCLDTFSCDKQVLTAVLNQLTKMETNPSNQILKGSSNLSGEGSSGSYLSQVGMPQIWNNY